MFNRSMMLKKIVISPLIVVVLLIAFSVAMSAIIMEFGEGYITENAEFVRGASEVVLGCNLVDFSIIKIEGVRRICQQENRVVVWLDNGPKLDLFNVFARIIGESDVATGYLLEIPLKKNSAVKAEFLLEKTGLVQHVKLTPEILIDDEAVVCSEKTVEVEAIPVC